MKAVFGVWPNAVSLWRTADCGTNVNAHERK